MAAEVIMTTRFITAVVLGEDLAAEDSVVLAAFQAEAAEQAAVFK